MKKEQAKLVWRTAEWTKRLSITPFHSTSKNEFKSGPRIHEPRSMVERPIVAA